MKKLLGALAALLLAANAAATTYLPVPLLNPTGSTSGQAIISTGASSAPGWGNVTATALAAQAANTVVANFTASSASPTAFAMPSCSGSANALQYTSGTGITCGSNYALLSSPSFNGTPTAPTATAGTNSTQIATTAFVATSFAPLASPALTGTPTAPTAVSSTNTTQLATTAFANAAVTGGGNPGSFTTLAASSTVSGAGFTSLLSPYAPLASPALTGTPTAPTASAATNNTQLATTAFANGAVTGGGNPGSFTTLNASGNDALLYTNTSAQSIANNALATVTTWTKTSDRVNANFNASTGVFTAPATGYYQISGQLTFSGAAGVVNAQFSAAVVANSVVVAEGAVFQQSTSTALVSVPFSAVVSLTSGQTLVVQAFQTSGAARTLSSTAALTYVSINRLP